MIGSGKKWEPKDVDVTVIFLLAILLLVGNVVFGLMSGGFFRFLSVRRDAAEPPPSVMAQARDSFPEPRLQAYPVANLAQYRAAQDHALESYGWVDRTHGIVRIPIDRAMDLLLQRGLPASPPAGTELQFRERQGARTSQAPSPAQKAGPPPNPSAGDPVQP